VIPRQTLQAVHVIGVMLMHDIKIINPNVVQPDIDTRTAMGFPAFCAAAS